MEVVKVEKDEQRVLRVLFDPMSGRLYYCFSVSLDFARLNLFCPMKTERAVINIKTGIESESLVQNITAHKGGSPISPCLQ